MIGALCGLIFFKVFDIVNGPLDDLAFWISVVGWGGSGVFVGCYGFYFCLKIEKLRKLNSNDSKSQEHKS